MIQSKSYGLQNETRQYLRRLYAYGRELNPTDVADIDNFIKGLKQLNLWQNIVCWPMRSIHNIGSGANALSLGGGQQVGADATLLNAATWSVDGIVRSTAGGPLFSTPIRDIGVAPVAHGAVFKNATDLGDNAGYWFTAEVNVSGRQFSIGNSSLTNAQNFTCYVNLWPPGVGSVSVLNVDGGASTPFTRTGRHYFSMRLTSGTTARFTLNTNQVNQSVAGSNWNTSTPSFVRFGGYNVALNSTTSLVFLSNSLVSDIQDASLYRLIKTTIGKGLGLP
jgi:hypothetical protein